MFANPDILIVISNNYTLEDVKIIKENLTDLFGTNYYIEVFPSRRKNNKINFFSYIPKEYKKRIIKIVKEM